MADIQEIYSILLAKGYQRQLFSGQAIHHQENRNKETLARCPFCGDESHFSYSSEKPVYQCWKCSERGDWLQYLQKAKGLEFRDALQELAEEAGVELEGYTEQDRQAWKAKQKKAELLEMASLYFQTELLEGAGLDELEYLLDRGYTREQLEEMELGAYCSRPGLVAELQKYGYTEQDIQQAGLLSAGLGESHTVATVWRESSGKAIGIACRAMAPAEGEKKYKYSFGMDKSHGLVGLDASRGAEQLILVEGILDALLLSKFYKIPTVAIGGLSISAAQAKALEWSGCKELLLALDMDDKGQKATARAIQQLRKSSGFRLYVVSLPAGYKDADELIRKAGIEAFQDALKQAERWPSWLARYLIQKHDISTARGMDAALDEALQVYELVSEGLDARAYRDALQQATGLAEEDISKKLQELSGRLQAEKRSQILKKLGDKLQGKASEGDMLGSEMAIQDALKELRQTRGLVTPEPYLLADFTEDLLSSQPGLKAGYQKLDEILSLPRGAISIIAGRPGHGKTTFLLNLLAGFQDRYPSKAFYYFSYEEAKKFLALKLIMLKGGQVLDERFNQEAHLNYLKFKRGSNERNEPIEKALAWYEKMTGQGRLTISDTMPTVEDLIATLENVCQLHDVGAILVDYIQRIPVARPAGQRYLDIKHVSASLLSLAVSQDIPIILGAQLGRGAGEGKEPSLGDLREAGDIEQDASVVLSLYNPSVAEIEAGQPAAQRKVDITLRILKQRGGLAGQKATLCFDRPVLSLSDVSPMRAY